MAELEPLSPVPVHEPSKTATATAPVPVFQKQKRRTAFFQQTEYMPSGRPGAYILTPDEFLFDGIGRLGLLDDAAVILGAVLTVFFPDGE